MGPNSAELRQIRANSFRFRQIRLTANGTDPCFAPGRWGRVGDMSLTSRAGGHLEDGGRSFFVAAISCIGQARLIVG